jgi:hypothetical protein
MSVHDAMPDVGERPGRHDHTRPAVAPQCLEPRADAAAFRGLPETVARVGAPAAPGEETPRETARG